MRRWSTTARWRFTYNGRLDTPSGCLASVRAKNVSLFCFFYPVLISILVLAASGKSQWCVRTDLNNCPLLPPPGFDAWYANGGSTYYAPSFAVKNIVSPKRPQHQSKVALE